MGRCFQIMEDREKYSHTHELMPKSWVSTLRGGLGQCAVVCPESRDPTFFGFPFLAINICSSRWAMCLSPTIREF
jgi:hypothetical protein